MSVSPLQNFLNPPPVPEMPTVTFTSGCSPGRLRGGLAQRPTVLDPSTTTGPDKAGAPAGVLLPLPGSAVPPPQADRSKPAAAITTAARAPRACLMITMDPFSPRSRPSRGASTPYFSRGTALSNLADLNGR